MLSIGLREQYGCSVMIPALEVRGPERIITIKAGNYNLIGKIVSRCAEHLDEFLRRNIPLRLLLPEYGIQNFPQNLFPASQNGIHPLPGLWKCCFEGS